MNKYEIVGELRSVEFDKPSHHCGYYGVVLKPSWMPKWLAYMLRKKLTVHYAWMNQPNINNEDKQYWWVYPSGDSRYENGDKAESIKVKPLLWCTIKVPYKVRITFLGGNPFNCKLEDPNGECAQAI